MVIMNNNLAEPHISDVTIDAAQSLENDINSLRKVMRKENLNMVAKKQVSTSESMAFHTIIGLTERAADHITDQFLYKLRRFFPKVIPYY